MHYRAILLRMALLIAVMCLLLGCSGGSETVLPGDAPLPQIVAAADETPGEKITAPLLWGLYSIAIDGATQEVDVLPMRGAEWCLNVVSYLQPPGGSLSNINVNITSWAGFFTQGTLTLDVSLTHPFPGVPKFTGFDVKGVVLGDGQLGSVHDSTMNYPLPGTDLELLNADGNTRWMNAQEFTTNGLWGYTHGALGTWGYVPNSKLNGYKYFADGLTKTQDVKAFFSTPANIVNRGAFMPGSSNTREYQLKFPVSGGPQVNFNYAVLANWAMPSQIPPSLSHFPPGANAREAMHIDVSDNGSNVFYVSPLNFGGNLRLNIEVFDWQGQSKPAGIPGEISTIVLESVTQLLPGGPIDIFPMAGVSAGTGISSVFTIDIGSCVPASSAPVDLIVTVESASPSNYAVGGGAVFPLTAKLSGYTMYTAGISSSIPNTQPTVSTPNGKLSVYSIDIELYQVTANDPDPGEQATLTYTWSVIPTGLPPSYTLPGDPTPGDFTINYGTAGFITGQGNYDISCQVKDISGMPNDTGTSPSPLTVTVQNTQPIVSTPTGQLSVWTTDIILYQVVGFDPDPWDSFTYTWSVVLSGSPAVYNIPGDPTPGDLTIDFATAPYITGPGLYDISCEIDDGSGWPNAKGFSASPLTVGVYTPPYTIAKVFDFLLFPNPHQGTFIGCPPVFSHFLTGFPEHDICILPTGGLNFMIIADDAGVGPGGPPPAGGVHYYGYIMPLGPPPPVWPVEPPAGMPFQIPPLQPTRFDGNGMGEMFIAHGSPSIGLIGLFPEYAYSQAFVWIPGGPVPPPLAWLGDHTTFNGITWEAVADVTNGFSMGGPSNFYTLFACDYTTFLTCAVPIPNGLCPGTCNIYQSLSPHAAAGISVPMITSNGVPSPGPGIIDDSLHSAMSVAVDEMPTNPGLTLPVPMLVYVLDAEGDIEIWEVDFVNSLSAYYGTLSQAFISQGKLSMMPVDCELVYVAPIITSKPLPPDNIIAVMSFDIGSSVMTLDAFTVGPGLDNATPIYTNVTVPTLLAMRMDVDEGTGDIYLLHDSIAAPGVSAASVYSY